MTESQGNSATVAPYYFGGYEFTVESIYDGLVRRTTPFCTGPEEEMKMKEDAKEVAESMMLLFDYGYYTSSLEEQDVTSLVACFQSKYDRTYRVEDWTVDQNAKVASGTPDWPSIEERSEDAKQLFISSDNTSRYVVDGLFPEGTSEPPGSLVIRRRVLYRTQTHSHGGNEIGLWWMTANGKSHEYEARFDRQWSKRQLVDLGEVANIEQEYEAEQGED